MDVSIAWGVPGVAESARLFPADAPRLAAFLQARGLSIYLPDHGPRDLAGVKDPLWILPFLDAAKDLSLGVLGGLLTEYLTAGREGQDRDRPVRVVIRREGQAEIRIEGKPEDVAEALRGLE
jgi:hypothetical protein